MTDDDEKQYGEPDSPNRLRSMLLAAAAFGVCAAPWAFGWLPAMDRVAGDFLLRTSSAPERDGARITAIVIDDRAIDLIGPLPWPRSRIAQIVAESFSAGARAVAVDLILSDATYPAEDLKLAEALAMGPSVIATAFDADGEWLVPLDIFGGAGAAAHAYGEVGPDGVIRSFSATKQSRGQSFPALSLAAARHLRPDLPIAPGSMIRPDFQPAPQQLPRLSAASLFDGSLSGDELRDRLVFVGISATGAGDQFVIPTGPRHKPVAGVLAHASSASSIIRGRLLRNPPFLWTMVVAFILASGVQFIRDRSGAYDLSRFALLTAGVVVVAVVALRAGRTVLPLASLIVVMMVSALLREAFESRIASREIGRLLRSLLRHIGSPEDLGNPRNAQARLDALQRVQNRILDEDSTRQALLAGMAEGVVLWGHSGLVLSANPAVEKLWGHVPTQQEFDDVVAKGSVVRHLRELSISTTDLESGRLAIIRDVTADRSLERRRKEMQRLVSHELKTPLASISGLGETLERYQLSGDELARVSALIRGEADRLHDMVTVFLDLDRLSAGHWEGEIEAIDPGALVHHRLEILQAAAAARDIQIAPSVEKRCKISVVPALFERVIDNLVGNAIKYTNSGDQIEVGLHRENDFIILTVRDHGPGIPAEARDRLFDRFYRVPGTKVSGAGLGLSLVSDIVSWHGGCIDCESEPGSGSIFTVNLPAVVED